MAAMLLRKNVLAGLMFIAVAVLGLWVSRNYPVGTALRMGTGYVPRLLCWMLLGLGGVDPGAGPARAASRQRKRDRRDRLGVASGASSSPRAWSSSASPSNGSAWCVAILLLVGIGAVAARELRPLETLIAAAGADRAVVGDLHRRPRADRSRSGRSGSRWNCSHNLAIGFGVALTPANLGFAFVGALVGTLIGVLPGIGPIATIAMLLPLTFHLEPVSGLIMLAGIFYGAQYGGSTTAILVNLPGETSSVVTCIDGHQMARQGRAGAALAIAALGSFFAGMRGDRADRDASRRRSPRVGQSFGAPEYFSLMVLGLIAAVVLAHGSVIKAIAMIVLGLLLGLVGTDGNTGGAALHLRHHRAVRRHRLRDAGDRRVRRRRDHRQSDAAGSESRSLVAQKITRLWPTREEFRRAWPAVLRGTALGSMLGVLPGGGATLVLVRRLCAGEEGRARPVALRPGRGRRRGRAGIRQQCRRADLVHPDADARHSRQCGDGADDRRADDPRHPARPAGHDRAPGAVLGHGRQHVDRQSDAGRHQPAADRHLGAAAEGAVPVPLSRRSCCSAPSASTPSNNSAFAVLLAALFGVLGYVFMRLECEPAPMILGFVLGPLMEENLRRAMRISGGDPMIFVNRPISLGLLIAAAVLLVIVALPAIRSKREEAFQEG